MVEVEVVVGVEVGVVVEVEVVGVVEVEVGVVVGVEVGVVVEVEVGVVVEVEVRVGVEVDVIRFTVEGPPVGKERPRRGRGGQWYTPRKTLDYEAKVRAAFVHAKRASGQTCKGWSVTIRMYHAGRRRPDGDNVLKAVIDGLNGVAYTDDRLVTCMHVVIARDDLCPRLEVEVV